MQTNLQSSALAFKGFYSKNFIMETGTAIDGVETSGEFDREQIAKLIDTLKSAETKGKSNSEGLPCYSYDLNVNGDRLLVSLDSENLSVNMLAPKEEGEGKNFLSRCYSITSSLLDISIPMGLINRLIEAVSDFKAAKTNKPDTDIDNIKKEARPLYRVEQDLKSGGIVA